MGSYRSRTKHASFPNPPVDLKAMFKQIQHNVINAQKSLSYCSPIWSCVHNQGLWLWGLGLKKRACRKFESWTGPRGGRNWKWNHRRDNATYTWKIMKTTMPARPPVRPSTRLPALPSARPPPLPVGFFGNAGILESGNPEICETKNPKNTNSQNPNLFCPKCRQGLN